MINRMSFSHLTRCYVAGYNMKCEKLTWFIFGKEDLKQLYHTLPGYQAYDSRSVKYYKLGPLPYVMNWATHFLITCGKQLFKMGGLLAYLLMELHLLKKNYPHSTFI
jgi:hypothetical protein